MNKLYQDIRSYGTGIICAILAIIVSQIFFRKICALSIVAGIPCPACGMTRAAVLFFQGRFQESIDMHPLFLPLAAIIAVMLVFRYIIKKTFPYGKICAIIFLISLVLLYGYRMYVYFPNKVPMNYDQNNLIYIARLILRSMIS